jgi:hypothetical protein
VNGNLIKLTNSIRMICQVSPCVYTVYVDPSTNDLTTWTNIQHSLTFNDTTKIFTFVWNDPSQSTTQMNLTVWQDSSSGSTIVCSNNASSFTGVLACNVSAYTGTLRAEAWRSASPPNLIDQAIAQIRSTFAGVSGGKTMGLFIGLLLLIAFALMGIFSPVVMIILGVVALIPLVMLGNITIVIFAAIGILGGVILHFLKRIT